MVRTNRYWNKLDNLWLFEKGLARIPRRYYVDIVGRYKATNFLDLGCGLGTTYRMFAKQGVEIDYSGIDITPNFIAYCKKNFPGVDFQRASINKVPFGDSSFDIVASRAVLEHLRSPYKAIEEMARVTRNVAVITWFKQPRKREKLHYRQKIGVWENIYSRLEILDALAHSALTVIEEFRVFRHFVWVMKKG